MAESRISRNSKSAASKYKVVALDDIIAQAQLNNGYVYIAELVTILLRKGHLTNLPLDNAKRYLNKILKASGEFEPVFDASGRRIKGAHKLKEHMQFK
jgi:hypothetical protein